MAPLAAKSSCRLPLRSRAALRVQVGFLAGYMKRIEIDAGIGQLGVNPALAFQVDSGNRDRQLIEAGFTAKLFGVRQRALEGDCAGQGRLAGKALHVGHLQHRADVEAGKHEFGLCSVVAVERGLPCRFTSAPSSLVLRYR